MWKKSIAAAALTCGLILAGGGVASAHECFIPNRSEQGNAGAAHSANWFPISVAEFFASAHLDTGGRALTEAEIAEAVAMAAGIGVPEGLVLFAPKTLPPSGPKGGGAGDGKGIDHIFEGGYLDALFGIFSEVRGG